MYPPATIELMVVGAGASIFALSTFINRNRTAIKEVATEVDSETDRLIDLLKEQRDVLSSSVDALSTKVDALAAVVMEMACKNAPICPNRVIAEAWVNCTTL
jgi:hypothetical protein